jgi:hypothetical protein
MAEMRLGYGSEYQLLRFLGHHRSELEKYILEDTKINENLEYSMEWLDYPRNNSRISLDGEHTGISFLPLELKNKISENWKKYWPQRGSLPNWDAILKCSPLDPNSSREAQWVIIEAKANLKEGIEEGTHAEDEKSIKKIEKAFEATQKRFNIKAENNWLKKYYQFANRLAFINFMRDNGIECSLLNIYFLNGYVRRKRQDPKTKKDEIEIIEDKSVKTESEWRKVIDTEYTYLGINDNAKEYISEIFVDCKKAMYGGTS